ncbi:hypothetical protein KI387_037326, partial [Taxus chinensis]
MNSSMSSSAANSSAFRHKHYLGSDAFGYEICIAVGLALLMVALFFVCLRCIREHQNPPLPPPPPPPRPPPPPSATTALDISVVETTVMDLHPTILYSNKHEALAHLQDRSCSICLDDYREKENL